MFRTMFVLFPIAVIAMYTGLVGAVSSQQRMMMRGLTDAPKFRIEANRLVAMGWSLFSGKFSYTGKSSTQDILFRDGLSPIYRRVEKAIFFYDKEIGHHIMLSEGRLLGSTVGNQ